MSPGLALTSIAAVTVVAIAVGIYIFTAEPPSDGAQNSSSQTGSPNTANQGEGQQVEHRNSDPESPAERAETVQRFWTTLTIPDESERLVAWHGMLAKMTAANAMEVRELFKKMDAQGRWFVPEWDAFWRRWGEVDGAAALEHVKTIGMKGYQPMLAEKIMRGWATSDPNAARRWFEDNPDSPWLDGGLRGYLDGFARSNLDAATQDALQLGKARDFTGLMEVLTEQALRQRELGGMVNWWRFLPDDPAPDSARSRAIGHVYWRLQIADPMRAGEWLASLTGTPYRPDKQIAELAGKLSASNPTAALKWVTTLPPSADTGRYTGVPRAVQALAKTDPVAVENWLSQQPSSPLRDQGIVAYSRHLATAGQDALSEQWRAKVSDPRWLEEK